MISWIDAKYEDSNFSYAKYKVLNTTVCVGSRPDCWGITPEFLKSVDAWLSVTDRYIDYPSTCRVRWFPWIEAFRLPYIVAYPCLITLHRWIIKDELSKVYIHCDAGTHRAPSIFGAFLYSFFNQEIDSIISNAQLIRREYLSSPKYYIEQHIRKNPDLIPFLKAMEKFPFEKDRNFEFMEDFLKKLNLIFL